MAITPESPAFPKANPVPGIDQDQHASADARAYVRGAQELSEQAATYSLFLNMLKWGSLAVAVVVLFLILWFQPNGSFFGALVPAAVVAVAGWWFLRAKPAR